MTEVTLRRWHLIETFGMTMMDNSMRLRQVREGSAGDVCGLRKYIDWTITHVDGNPVKSTQDLLREVKDKLVTVVRLEDSLEKDFSGFEDDNYLLEELDSILYVRFRELPESKSGHKSALGTQLSGLVLWSQTDPVLPQSVSPPEAVNLMNWMDPRHRCIVYVLTKPTIVTSYSIRTAISFPYNDPSCWIVEGSIDSNNWNVLSTVSCTLPGERLHWKTFHCRRPVAVSDFVDKTNPEFCDIPELTAPSKSVPGGIIKGVKVLMLRDVESLSHSGFLKFVYPSIKTDTGAPFEWCSLSAGGFYTQAMPRTPLFVASRISKVTVSSTSFIVFLSPSKGKSGTIRYSFVSDTAAGAATWTDVLQSASTAARSFFTDTTPAWKNPVKQIFAG